MRSPSTFALRVVQVFLAVAVPLTLLLTAVRLVLSETYVRLEYQTPNFPADPYGMTQDERLTYGPLALAFLLNEEDITFLADQTFADGSLLYNERELRHMQDVKDLTQAVLALWYALIFALIGLAVWARSSGWTDTFRSMLASGGKLTLFLLAGLLVFAALSFNAFFTGFHAIFFEGDSWLFLYSDTLIRLFPLRFWRDVIFVIGGLTILGALALWLGLTRKRPA